MADPSRGPAPLAPGSRIGKYVVVRLLATGGFAEVYLVQSRGPEGFAKLLVAKRLLPQLAARPDYVDMFLDEARLAARLRHPNLVQVYDFGLSDVGHFLTMEYVEGESLAHVIQAAAKKQRGMSLANSLRVVAALSAGLHYVHELRDKDGMPLSIVHRDVSPQNVMLTFDGNIKLLDFGIASATNSRALAPSQGIRGSLRTMSPEQCAGEPLDRRSDVFSLGVMLFELTTGTLFHRESDESSMRAQILDGPWPLPTTRRANYPAELERIVMKALERDPRRRTPTAEALQIELEAFAQAHGHRASNIGLAEFMREVIGEPPRLSDELDPNLPDESVDVASASGARVHRRKLTSVAWLAALVTLSVLGATLTLGLGRGSKPNRASEAKQPVLAASGGGGTPSPPSPAVAMPAVSQASEPVEARPARSPTAPSVASIGARPRRSLGPPRADAGPGPAIPAHSTSKPPDPVATAWTLDSPLPP